MLIKLDKVIVTFLPIAVFSSSKWKMSLTTLLESLKAVLGLILVPEWETWSSSFSYITSSIQPKTPIRALIWMHFKLSKTFSFPPATWAVPHMNPPRNAGLVTKTSPPQPVSDTTPKMHNIVPIFPNLQGCRNAAGRVVIRGPIKRGNGARIKKKKKNQKKLWKWVAL